MQVIVDGLVTNYLRQGAGKSILFLHGWGDSSQTYLNLIKDLSDSYDCIAVDLPGFGGTEPPTTPWHLDEYGIFVRHFLEKIGASKPKAIIAHSNGAAVAIRGIRIGNLLASRLVLLGAAGIRESKSFKLLLLKVIAKVGKAVTFWLPGRYKRKLQIVLYGAAGSDMLVVPALKETFKLTVRQDVQEDAKNIPLPTLLIYGTDDRATPPAYGKKYNELIQGSYLELLPGSHFIHQDQPVKTASLIKDFLR